MPSFFIIVFSLIIYSVICWVVWKKRELLDFRGWPKNPTLFRIWAGWIVLLVLIAPLSYCHGDMLVWLVAVINLLIKKPLPDSYVYLPVYAELLSALSWPFVFAGIESTLLLVYAIKLLVIFSYLYCAKLMSEILPEQSELAPLGIVLAPVTILYIFFGTNHIVMFFCLLASLVLMKKEKWFWSGFFAFFSCFKFLLIPTLLVLLVLLLIRHGLKKVLLFCLGGVLFLAPSFIYYYDPALLLKIIANQAALGGHCGHIEQFHFFFFLNSLHPGFQDWYVGHKLWFYLCLSGIPLSILFYLCKRLNFSQCLAFSCAVVAIFALEPFRLEPTIGLLWLDAVYRKDLRAQLGIFSILFVHAAVWYDLAYSRVLSFHPSAPLFLWNFRGLFLGLAIIITLLIILFEKDKRDFMFEEFGTMNLKLRTQKAIKR
jgi:hypothetical protein